MVIGEMHSLTTSRILDKDLGGDKDLLIISMGDFNKEPFDRSMPEYLLGSRNPNGVSF